MKIYAITVSSISVASSRLRSFYLFWFSKKYGVVVCRNNFLSNIDADILHIQKKVTITIFLQACTFRLLGKLVIFDLDDQPSSFLLGRYWLGEKLIWFAFYVMIFTSSFTIVDTYERKKYWQKFYFRKIHVLMDVVDVNPQRLLDFYKNTTNINWNKNIVWLGHPANLRSIEKIIQCEDIKNNFNIKVITAERSIPLLKIVYPWVEFISWKNDILLDKQFLGSYMILNQFESSDSVFKSDNKMALALFAGLTPIVSRTPSYIKLAENIESKFLLYSSLADVINILNQTTDQLRQQTFLSGKKFIYDNYRAEIIFEKFLRKSKAAK